MSLNGVSILVIRDSDEFSFALQSEGAEVTNLPLIRTEPIEDISAVGELINRINEYDGVFFTSAAAAEIFGTKIGHDTYRGKIYTFGAKSKEVFARLGRSVEYQPDIATAEDLVHSYGSCLNGKKFLFVRGDRSLRTIPQLLRGSAVVDELVVYRTVTIRPDRAVLDVLSMRLAQGDLDWTCFFSPSGVGAFGDLFGKDAITKTAAIGTTTAARATERGMKVEFIPPRPNDFAQAFVKHLNGTKS